MVLLVFGDKVVQVVSQEISAVHASMPVKHSKIGWFFPVRTVFRATEIQNNGHSVLVILAYWTLVRGGGVCSNSAVSVLGVFGGFEV